MSQKTPLVDGLNRFVSDKVTDIGQLIGKSLPASVMAVDPSNTIVTVNFEVRTTLQLGIVQCPIGFPEYVRWPIQKGDKGFVVSCDLYMGGMSGLGGGVATLAQQPNLATLVWFPCGNIGFDATDDPQAVVLYGPNGVVLRDKDKKSVVTVSSDSIEMTRGGGTFLMNDSMIQMVFGAHSIVIDDNNVTIDGVPFMPHTHDGVMPGGGDTGPVNP